MPPNNLAGGEKPQWPEIAIPAGVKSALETVYRLIDTESEEAYLQCVDMFVPDGLIEIGAKRIEGREGTVSSEITVLLYVSVASTFSFI
jgi:hypothetical protein